MEDRPEESGNGSRKVRWDTVAAVSGKMVVAEVRLGGSGESVYFGGEASRT